MNKQIGIIIVIVFTTLIGCSKPEPQLPPLEVEEISGEVLWNRIAEESLYKDYSTWEDHQGILPGQSPHGVNHEIFVNNILLTALPVQLAPEGSIIVKENYNTEEEMVKITVMAKVEDWDPENNDWFWAAYDPEGKVLAEGSPAGCISCHEGMKDNDFIIIHNLSRGL